MTFAASCDLSPASGSPPPPLIASSRTRCPDPSPAITGPALGENGSPPSTLESIGILQHRIEELSSQMKKQRDLEATQEEQAKELEKVLPRGLYVDSSKPPQGQELIICDNKKLSIQETARLEFGRQLIGGIAETIQLRAAKSLPPSDGYENNAFFGLVAIHALSHIKSPRSSRRDI